MFAYDLKRAFAPYNPIAIRATTGVRSAAAGGEPRTMHHIEAACLRCARGTSR
jgi:hypothetical protein